jgi:general secretion pathway protein G
MNPPRLSFPSSRLASRAFTLLEILVVLAIIGMLVGLSVAGVTTIMTNKQVATTELFVQTMMKTPLTTYQLDNGALPSTDDGLQALLTLPAGKDATWKGPYLDTVGNVLPLDPWHHTYQYKAPGTHNAKSYDIWSLGPDGADGTADDIGNWAATATSP